MHWASGARAAVEKIAKKPTDSAELNKQCAHNSPLWNKRQPVIDRCNLRLRLLIETAIEVKRTGVDESCLSIS
jgi:hypothetical protein